MGVVQIENGIENGGRKSVFGQESFFQKWQFGPFPYCLPKLLQSTNENRNFECFLY
jgi:hypothetical protein